MEEQVKNIISKYTKIPADQLQPQTLIDRSAVASSIILHRMYAQLAAEGFAAANYADIKTYGQLLSVLNNTGSSASVQVAANAATYQPNIDSVTASVGIDIEPISSMPPANDYREDAFYTMNFSPAEIAYCILQTNPAASFAGLFAAKEAIIKADNSYQHHNFNTIIIDHLPGGKPIHPGFEISISHTGDLAVAVAVKNSIFSAGQPSTSITSATGNSTIVIFVAIAALLLSLLCLGLFLFKSA